MTKRKTQALLKAAKEEHAVIEVQTAFGVVRLFPSSLPQETKPVDPEPEGHF
jgi:hypothetical protein